jgi:hypothetical protein
LLAVLRRNAMTIRSKSPFENPDVMAWMRDALEQRGEAWAASVLGRNLERRSLITPSVPWLEPGEAELLVLAHAAEPLRRR